MSVPALDQQKERKWFANDSLSPAYVHHKTPHQVPLTLSCSCCELIYPTVWNQTERKNTHMRGVQHTHSHAGCATHLHHSWLLLTCLDSTDFNLSYSRTVSQSNKGWDWGHMYFTHCECSRCPSRCQSHLTPSWDKQNCSKALPNFSCRGKGNPMREPLS